MTHSNPHIVVVPIRGAVYEVTVDGSTIVRIVYYPDLVSSRSWPVDFSSLPERAREEILTRIANEHSSS